MSGSVSGAQWLRKIRLRVGNSAGDGWDLSQMQIQFNIRHSDLQTPNTADIRIYNLSDQTARYVRKEFDQVILEAGYENAQFGQLFKGQIKQWRRGREDPTSTFLDIHAADGDQAYNFGVMNATLSGGWTVADLQKKVDASFSEHGVNYTQPPPGDQSKVLPRGKVCYGMTRDYMRDLSNTQDCSWSIQDGKVVMIPNKGYLEGEAVVLTAGTGMIGLPHQTPDGIVVQCLLNPTIRYGRRIHIDNSSIQEYVQNRSIGGEVTNTMIPKITNDGFYRVLLVDHQGNTRGADWHTHITCISIDGTVPPSLVARGVA